MDEAEIRHPIGLSEANIGAFASTIHRCDFIYINLARRLDPIVLRICPNSWICPIALSPNISCAGPDNVPSDFQFNIALSFLFAIFRTFTIQLNCQTWLDLEIFHRWVTLNWLVNTIRLPHGTPPRGSSHTSALSPCRPILYSTQTVMMPLISTVSAAWYFVLRT